MIDLKFELPRQAGVRSINPASPLVTAPTFTIILADYNNNRSINMIITSEFILSYYKHIKNSYNIINKLEEDPMAALRIGKITIDQDVINELRKQGYLFILNRTLGYDLPTFKWETLSNTSCNQWTPVDSQLGIYYSKNLDHPAAHETTPQWWKRRFIQINEHSADEYWVLFRDRLVAAQYYVPANADMNKAIQAIANWAFNPNAPKHEGSGLYAVNVVSLEKYVGANHWNNSLPTIAYQGLIPIFSYKINNLVGTISSERSMMVSFSIVTASTIGYVSGLLASGMYLSVQSASNLGFDNFADNQATHDFSQNTYLKGIVYSPGDYIITVWKTVSKIQCNGITYKVIVPRTITVPLYTITLDFGHVYVYNSTTIDSLEFLTQPGESIILSNFIYNNSIFIGDYHTMFKFEVKQTNASMNHGYLSIVGGPVFKIILSIFNFNINGAYEELSANTSKILLNTGYVNVKNTGEAVIITLKLQQTVLQPNETYIINIVNKVPRELDGVHGITSLTWGGLIITIETP
ncbi:MAG: hypothetical protein F7B19_02175 [Desulfurococcales archaeon]|nr:hypothetical protein [Desulfurococcales archaeon]